MAFPSVLVIGAGGFIGAAVAAHCVGRGGPLVRAGVRNPRQNPTIVPGAETVTCDADNEESLRAAMHGVDCAILCTRDDARQGAATAAANATLSAAKAVGVGRVVLMSSVAAYGAVSGEVEEATAAVPPLSSYAAEKLAIEQAARERAAASQNVTIIRPALVYGPGGEEWTAHFIRAIAQGKLRQMGDAGDGDANLVYVDDLAALCAFMIERDAPGYEIFNANGPETPTFNEYFSALNTAMGMPPLGPPRAPFAVATERLLRKIGRKLTKVAPVPGIALWLSYRFGDEPSDAFSHRVHFNMQRAHAAGFHPQTGLEEGVRKSVLWAKQAGLF